jgi:hypothetical protein
MKAVETVVGRTFIEKARMVVLEIELLFECLARRSRYAILPRAFASIAMQTLNTLFRPHPFLSSACASHPPSFLRPFNAR